MNEKTWPDTLKVVIDMLASCIPGVWVADHLPGPAELDSNLPAVVVDLLPGDEIVGWGGVPAPLGDDLVLDVDVFATSRAAAVPLATQVRQLIHGLPNYAGSNVKAVHCPSFSTRPDYNPHIRRLGGTVKLLVTI